MGSNFPKKREALNYLFQRLLLTPVPTDKEWGGANVTADGKPLIIVEVAKLDLLQIRARELAALKKIQTSSSELQTDGVARSEVLC